MTSIHGFIRKYRSELLMWLYIALLLASPVSDAHPRVGFVISLVLFITTIYGSTFMAESRMLVRFILPLAGLWMVAHVLQLSFGNRYQYSPYIGLVLVMAIVVGIVSKFSDKSDVTRNLIAEAVISYLLIAVGFSQLYWIMNRLIPNAFNPPVPVAEQSTYLYFSLTTLTTVGFGDIQPVNHYVRFAAAFEAVVGVFYLAVIISRLVSNYRFNR